MPGSSADFSLSRSVKIKDRLIGTIKSKWVYSSACRARAKVPNRGCHPTMSETANRSAKCRNGDFAAIALLGGRHKDVVKPRLRDMRAMVDLSRRTSSIESHLGQLLSCDPDHRPRCRRRE